MWIASTSSFLRSGVYNEWLSASSGSETVCDWVEVESAKPIAFWFDVIVVIVADLGDILGYVLSDETVRRE